MALNLQTFLHGICLLSVCIIVFEDYIHRSSIIVWLSEQVDPNYALTSNFHISTKSESDLKVVSNTSVFSSVWCRGTNHTNRVCKFSNLCYLASRKKFLFLHSSESVISGVPTDRFNPALSDFSSVEDHNTLFFNYVDVPSDIVKNYTAIYLDGEAIIFKRFNPDNLMHVFHDDLLPVFSSIEELDNLSKNGMFLAFADDQEPGPYAFLYENFLNSKPVYLNALDINKLVCLRKSYVGLNKLTTWYQYGFNQPQGPLNKDFAISSSVIKRFRLYFSKQFNISERNERENSILFLSRSKNRKVLNEHEVVAAAQKLTNLKHLICSLEENTVIEIVKAVKNCSILIGMHGSLLILSLFLHPGSILIELFPYAINSKIYTPYRTLALLPEMGIIYRAWENKFKNKTISHPEYPIEYGGIHHLSLKEQQRILQSTSVAPHLCCYNPEWLFYIYQDTKVDIPSFAKALQSAVDEKIFLGEEIQNYSGISNIVNHRLYPDEIEDVMCSSELSNANQSKLILSWKPPWNVQYIPFKVIEYEIWIQLLGSDNVQAYITKKTSFVFNTVSSGSLHHVWIRSYIDGRLGPFTSNPLICNSHDSNQWEMSEKS